MTNSSVSSIGIFTTDTALNIRGWDDWLAYITGITAEQAHGQSLTELFPEITTRRQVTYLNRALTQGTVEVLAPAFHRYLIPCAPLAPSPYFDQMRQHVIIAPLREDDHIIGLIVTIEDVTARLDHERDLAIALTSEDEAVRLTAAQALAEEQADTTGEPLLGALGDDSWRVRRVAASGLAQRKGEQIVAMLLRTLREEHLNFSVLSSTLQALGLSNADITEPLLALLREPDPNLRAQAALALGERGDARATYALIQTLSDEDANVRYHVIEALGKVRALDAVEVLITIAETRDFYLAFPALDALAKIKDPRAAGRIVTLLTDETLSTPAAEALGQIGDEEAVGPLALLLNKQKAAAQAVASSLAAIYYRYEKRFGEATDIVTLARKFITATGAQNLLDTLGHASAEELRGITLVLGWLEGTAVERALTRLLGEPKVRQEVIEALVRHGDRVTQLLVGQLEAEDLETRQAAVIALGQIGDPRATPGLIQVLTQDSELTILAAGALAKIGDRRTFEPLLGLLGHPQAAIRRAAVAALNSLGHPETATRIQALLIDPDPLIRESTVKIAGYFGYANCSALVMERCRDEVEYVRCTALEQLPYLEEQNFESLFDEVLQSGSPRERAAVARALGYLESEVALPYLTAALADADSWVRYFALRSLARHDLSEAKPLFAKLVTLAQEDQGPQVRIAAIEALGSSGLPQAVPVLAPLAEASELDFAGAALTGLGFIKHPDAVAILLAARRSAEPERRKTAVLALGQHTGAEVVEALQWTATADTNEEVVQAALQGLANSKSALAIDALLTLAAKPNLRTACLAGLVQLGETQTAELARGLSRPQSEARYLVVEALSRIKNPDAGEHLRVAINDPDAAVRLAAIAALGHKNYHVGK